MAVLRWDVGSIGGSDGEGEEGDDSKDEQFVITSGVSKERWVPFGCRWDKRFGRGHCEKRSEILAGRDIHTTNAMSEKGRRG